MPLDSLARWCGLLSSVHVVKSQGLTRRCERDGPHLRYDASQDVQVQVLMHVH